MRYICNKNSVKNLCKTKEKRIVSKILIRWVVKGKFFLWTPVPFRPFLRERETMKDKYQTEPLLMSYLWSLLDVDDKCKVGRNIFQGQNFGFKKCKFSFENKLNDSFLCLFEAICLTLHPATIGRKIGFFIGHFFREI